MSLLSILESILFVASKPLTVQTIGKAMKKDPADVTQAMDTLRLKYNRPDSGIHILCEGDTVRMATNPEHASFVDAFIKDEAAGELTKAQLETLTVIAYRGPITRGEIEQIRGVNCAVILRNLMIRGLIEEQEDVAAIVPMYAISMEALRHLGISMTTELPNYDVLHAHAYMEQMQGKTESE